MFTFYKLLGLKYFYFIFIYFIYNKGGHNHIYYRYKNLVYGVPGFLFSVGTPTTFSGAESRHSSILPRTSIGKLKTFDAFFFKIYTTVQLTHFKLWDHNFFFFIGLQHINVYIVSYGGTQKKSHI